MLEKYLEDLENRISPEIEEDVIAQWQSFWNREIPAGFFSPTRTPKPSALDWPEVHINDAVEDPSFETMLLHQLCGVSKTIGSADGYSPQIRTNYGTAIIASLFGAEVVIMPRETNTLPGSRPLGPEKTEALLSRGALSPRSGLGSRVLDCGRFFKDSFQDYPKLQKYCRIYHPDLQGPFDICEQLWGSEIFLALYDSPELIHRVMGLINATYIGLMDEWFKMVPPQDDLNPHYGWLQRGKIRISLDSCMNLSPDNYEEFVKPYDAALLENYGGVVHSCGRVDHFVPLLADIKGYCGFHLSQPEYNNMESVYQHTIDKGIPLLNLFQSAAKLSIKEGRELHGLVHTTPA